MKSKYLILGAGPTGLGAAYRLKELGISDYLIVDRAETVGGLSASHVDAHGFTWDIGGHIQFSHYAYFDRVMDEALGQDGWLHHQRESWVWIHDRFVPYPFQNNIRYLPKAVMWKCMAGIIHLHQNGSHHQPRNFREWILATFGEGIAEEFLLPYNFKVWAHAPEMMAYSWVGERVATTDLMRVAENVLFERDDLSWGPNNTFRFPRNGGTGAIWQAVADMVGRNRIHLGAEVTHVNAGNKTVTLSDNSTIGYDRLLSTVPLDRLTARIQGLPREVSERAAQLKHSSVYVVGFGLTGQPPASISSKCWMYFPEKNCPFYRATLFSKYSPNNVPDGPFWSLMVEISESEFKPVRKESLIEETIAGLLATKLIRCREQVATHWVYRAEYGYPTPCLQRDAILDAVLPEIEKLDISSRGRFGAWKYEVSNQDHSFMQGVEWVNRVELGIPELTVHYPNVANAQWGRRYPAPPGRAQTIPSPGRSTDRSAENRGRSDTPSLPYTLPAAPAAASLGSSSPAIWRNGSRPSDPVPAASEATDRDTAPAAR
jgi:protoporphyrinogen oxidase